MRKLVIAISALTIACTAAFAGPIEDRQALMKENGKAVGMIAPMIKGEKPFDAAVAQQALDKLAADAAMMDVAKLWPKGSETGGDSTSSPKIWEDPAGFQAAIDKFKADTAAASAAKPQDLDALKVQFGAVTANCGGCHKVYRVSKS